MVPLAMKDFVTALGLVLVIEGMLYGLAPDAMKRMMDQAQRLPASVMRTAGLAAAAVGLLVVWWVRR